MLAIKDTHYLLRPSSERIHMYVILSDSRLNPADTILVQWLPLLLTQSDVEKTMADMHNAGIKVLRTWVRF